MAHFRHTAYAALFFAFACFTFAGCGGEPAPAPDNADKQDLGEIQDSLDDIDLGTSSDAPSTEPSDDDSAKEEPKAEEPAKEEPKTDEPAKEEPAAEAPKESSATNFSSQRMPPIRLASYNANAGEWGTLKGRFVYDGKAPTPKKLDVNKEPGCKENNPVDETIAVGENGGLTGVVVYLYLGRGKKVSTIHPDYEADAEKNKTVLIDNLACRFAPHVQVLRTSQTLEIKNSDAWGHNTKYESLKQNFNRTIPAGQSETFKLSKAEKFPVGVVCGMHPWMTGYILVLDHPYMAVTGKDGSFEIKNLPAGKHEFVFWQEKAGKLKKVKFKGGVTSKKGRAKITIKAGDNDLGEIKIAPKLLK